MATKNNPGNFDCYANAKPDEPMFVLLGRDRHAPTLVRVWALLRAREREDEANVAEALQCADDMEAYARGIGKQPQTEYDNAALDRLLLAATDGMDEHPEDYDHSCGCDECLASA